MSQPHRTLKGWSRSQLIDSMAWFSFHVPDIVRENLVALEHDMDRLLEMKKNKEEMMSFHLPGPLHRECALLFIDISGFTKLSTVMNVEAFSETINSYFDLIVNEIKSNGGDVLKFAGDALFAEWRVPPNENKTVAGQLGEVQRGLKRLAFVPTIHVDPLKDKNLARCAADAALCGASIVEKFSDYKVIGCDVMLNVHCGVSAGLLTSLHVEDDTYNRREFLLLGEPIDQVAEAEKLAQHGELYASKECIQLLAKCCRVPRSILTSDSPASLIASRSTRKIAPTMTFQRNNSVIKDVSQSKLVSVSENLREDYSKVETDVIEMLQRQLALYVHPVIREDEFAKRMLTKGSSSVSLTHKRQRAEAELRSVYVMFIKPLIQAKITGNQDEDEKLYRKLHDIMITVCRQINQFKGHLRQFIVDDKGVVLIASFGLRWSTCPNMVAKRALPATLAIHRALFMKGVKSRIGATFGEAYCGVVGGIRRHEYSILGPSVNLAARLMCSSENEGILVDQSVQNECQFDYQFFALDPINAKGYDKPVYIFKPGRRLGRAERFSDIATSEKAITALYLQINDRLEFMTRRVLQTCAVLGDNFQLSDILKLNSDMDEKTVVKGVSEALTENILQAEPTRKRGPKRQSLDMLNAPRSQHQISTMKRSSRIGNTNNSMTKKINRSISDRTNNFSQSASVESGTTFTFRNDAWRQALLKTMLKDNIRIIEAPVRLGLFRDSTI